MPVSNREKFKLTPYWKSDCGRATVYHGDNMHVMMQLEPEQFHAVVTDPPYGLEFMGKEWDAPWKQNGSVDARQRRADELDNPIKAKYLRHQTTYGLSNPKAFQQWFFDRAVMMHRVVKPGAHLLSFGGTRMWHRMACAVEDAGWEIRDTVMWVYGSGFPKSHDVSKGIDKLMGVDRKTLTREEYIATKGEFGANPSCVNTSRIDDGTVYNFGQTGNLTSSNPMTDAAKQWDGWGTALKPAHEPIILARRSLVGTVVENVLEHNCGGLNVGECRVGDRGEVQITGAKTTSNTYGVIDVPGGKELPPGRWPANIIHDGSDEVTRLFPQSQSTRTEVTSTPGSVYGMGAGLPSHTGTYGFDDSGSAARFFYSAKADDTDRLHGHGDTTHPTCKPLDLMRYLVRLVCPRGGVLLDPFMGSGSTGCAAIAEGMHFVGIEQSREYADLAVERLKLEMGTHPTIVKRLGSNRVVVRDSPPPPRKLR